MAAVTSRPRATATGPDRITVLLMTLAGVLAVLAVLAWQFSAAATLPPRRVVVVRKIYVTRVVETIHGDGPGGSSVTQSVSTSGTSAPAAGLTTHTS
jgi:hypothetical protein